MLMFEALALFAGQIFSRRYRMASFSNTIQEPPSFLHECVLGGGQTNREDDEREDCPAMNAIIGSSAAMRQILDQVKTVAPLDSTVLIEGETGTGKELIASAIHNLSSRRR